MILPGFPVIIPAPASSGIVFPEVTINRADIGGAGLYYGYIRPGGYMASALGASGGSLSGTLVPGYVTDAVISLGGDTQIFIVGNCEALLTGVTAMMDNGTPVPLAGPFTYLVDDDITAGIIEDYAWSSTGTRTIQLV